MPQHPCNAIIQKPHPPRSIRHTARRNSTLARGTRNVFDLDEVEYKAGIKTIHCNAIDDAVANFAPNRVLNTPPPEVAKEERQLPRKTRSTLAQLRSGWCKILNSYQHRIDNRIANICPECGLGPHDVAHLFTCSRAPTNLTLTDLWKHPREAALFLKLPTDEDEEMDA
uniref:Uncharacterized protein n=1 Tax=Cacopsylla melanoneura TaxID=428564 RepID=A0A8D8RJ49_9HEMI